MVSAEDTIHAFNKIYRLGVRGRNSLMQQANMSIRINQLKPYRPTLAYKADILEKRQDEDTGG